jgi:hypothetical protein
VEAALLFLAGLAISFALPAFAEQKDAPDLGMDNKVSGQVFLPGRRHGFQGRAGAWLAMKRGINDKNLPLLLSWFAALPVQMKRGDFVRRMFAGSKRRRSSI